MQKQEDPGGDDECPSWRMEETISYGEALIPHGIAGPHTLYGQEKFTTDLAPPELKETRAVRVFRGSA